MAEPKTEKKTTKRVNTRLWTYQDDFIKAKAEKEKKTEGEVYREIVDFYITKNKK